MKIPGFSYLNPDLPHIVEAAGPDTRTIEEIAAAAATKVVVKVSEEEVGVLAVAELGVAARSLPPTLILWIPVPPVAIITNSNLIYSRVAAILASDCFFPANQTCPSIACKF